MSAVLRIKPPTPGYRARKLSVSEFSWAIERETLWGWKVIETGYTKQEAQRAVDFHANEPEILYPTNTETGTVDPLGIRAEPKEVPF